MGPTEESILLVDDDQAILSSTARLLKHEFQLLCDATSDGLEAIALAKTRNPSVILLDLGLADQDGEQVLQDLRQERPEIPVVIVTAMADLETAVRCMGTGAYDYVVKGSDPTRLMASVRRALESRRKDREIEALRERMQSVTLKNPQAFEAIITKSEHIRALFRFIEAVAGTDEPILIQGETGTGKELFAQAIHKCSLHKGLFVATNLGGLDDFMVSDTLFGHTKGAYTGADEMRKGLAVAASGGTLFLDEIGELSPASQVKLLRFLENREFFPLGSDVSRRSDARIVAATNRNLETLVEEGKFRRDLLYRLSTYRIEIPPLRDRTEDIPLLCRHILKSLVLGSESPVISPAAVAYLSRHPFPGNVRELRGLLMRAKVMAQGQPIEMSLVRDLLKPELLSPPPPPLAEEDFTEDGRNFPPELPTIQGAIQGLISEAMRRTGGQQNSAAALLGISPQALSKRLKRGLKGEKDDF